MNNPTEFYSLKKLESEIGCVEIGQTPVFERPKYRSPIVYYGGGFLLIMQSVSLCLYFKKIIFLCFALYVLLYIILKFHFKTSPDNLVSKIIIFYPEKLISKLFKINNDPGNKIKQDNTHVFGLWFGISTGVLASRSHNSGMAKNQNITLGLKDATQNICVLGGIGSGKTTGVILPLLAQLLNQDCGGLIFDVKGDFKNDVYRLADMCGRNVLTIGPGHQSFNLLSGLAPQVAASFLRSSFSLNSSSDSFWIDTATNLCQNSLGVLSFFEEHYTLNGLYQYIFDPEFRMEIEAGLSFESSELDKNQSRLLKSYMGYYDHIFSHFDEKVKSGVIATIAQSLAHFNQPDLIDSFCTEGPDMPFIGDVLNGSIFLVDMPLQVWGVSGKVVYTFVKQRFFNVIQNRNTSAETDKTRPVFFMCDEYQEIVSCIKEGTSDLNFWDKSRSSNCIGIISAQAFSSFYAAIGNRDLCNAVLQNFRQKIFFRTEDQPTLDYLQQLFGRVEIIHHSYNNSTSSGGFSRNSKTRGETVSTKEKIVVDPQLVRLLHTQAALCALNIGGESRDDVLRITPLYLEHQSPGTPGGI
jgi:type IV secretory pathway TraG/TraD family ATPase VirD4